MRIVLKGFCDEFVMVVKSFIYRFDNVRVEAREFRVFKNGEPITLEPKAFQALIFLLEQRGRLVTKDELMDAVWKDSFVTPNVLTRIVAQLRRALGDASQHSRYIETVPTLGYRFIAEVEETEAETSNAPNLAASKVSEQNQAANKEKEAAENVAESAADETTKQAEIFEPRKQATASFWKSRSGIISAVLILLAAAAAGSIYFVSQQNSIETKNKPDASEKTLAVLPFKLLNANDEKNYLSVGLADSLITKLSNVRSLTVRPTSSVMRYAQNERDAAGAGRELKVETVIDGAVQQAGDRVRVTVQLIRVADGKPLWANTYDAQFVNIFQVQDEISARVAEALKIQLSGNEQARLTRRPTDNIEAFQLYLRGSNHLYRFTPDDIQKAIQFFNQAAASDANYALAYAGLANAYGIGASFNIESATARQEAAARRAIELDPTLSEAHAALAVIFFWNKRDAGKAQDSFNRALELNLNVAATHHYYSWFLMATARFDEAETSLRRALELDPLSLSINIDAGLPLFFSRRYTEARARFEQALKPDANFWYGHLRLGEACEMAGDFACATSEFERAAALSNNDSTVKAHLVRTLALAGKRDEARRLLEELTAKNAPPVSPYYLALTYIALGETNKAFANLERALTENDKWLGWAKVDPRCIALRRDARFDDILRRAGFASAS